MNNLKIPGVIVMVLLLPGCSWGPIDMTHQDGRLPKVYIAMPVEDLKIRIHNLDEITLRLKKEF
ncbi:MAG: hypothetical protein O6932_06915 [Gammaproteobacteria bacterium]|nr:hypothetical protein [Gammaproteobacteria bacterium]